MFATVFEPTREELDMTKNLRYLMGHESLPLISDIPAVQAHYEKCRIEGTSHALAEMFAWQQPPAAMTDNVFNQGRCNGNQFEGQEWIGNRYAADARAAGVDITGATYLHGLAAYPGDPRAWVRDRGDVQRVCEERGWACRGAVNVRAREPLDDPKRNTPLAADIVDSCVERAIANDPGLAERPREEVRDAVIHKHKPHWTDKKPRKRQLDLAA